MKQKPFISVVIPMYNVADFIADCIESVLKQEFAAEKIICVDDHSTDNTVKIVRDYSVKHPALIELIELPVNKGGAAARNEGLRRATGNYIQFLDADDLLLPRKLDHQVEILNSLENEPDFIAAAYIRRAVSGNESKRSVKEKNNWLSLMTSGLGCTCSNLWKRESVLAIGGFNEKLKSSQEYGLMFDLLKNNSKIVFDNEPFTIVRDRPPGESVSRKDPPKNWEQIVNLRGDTLNYLESQSLIKKETSSEFYQPLFEAIRILYNFSPAKSVELYRKFIPGTFIPVPSASISNSYCSLYKIFGFTFTEKLRSISRIFKSKLKE